MTTENLREKINMLTNMVQSEDLQVFQQQMLVATVATSTGDAQVDQAMRSNAANAKAQILAGTRRLETYRAKLAELTAELDATSKEN